MVKKPTRALVLGCNYPNYDSSWILSECQNDAAGMRRTLLEGFGLRSSSAKKCLPLLKSNQNFAQWSPNPELSSLSTFLDMEHAPIKGTRIFITSVIASCFSG